MKKVILNLGAGTLTKGCEAIIGELLEADGQYPVRFTGQLPPAPELSELQRRWQEMYYIRNQDQRLRIHLLNVEGFRYSESDFGQVCESLIAQLNQWLNSPEFRSVDQVLRTELKRHDDVQIILETADPQLRRLPWHLWQLFEDYPRAELTYCSRDWRPLRSPVVRSDKTRILATFGSSEGLNVQSDLSALSDLPKTELTVLTSPDFNQLHESLWQPEGWDVFFFAGHSQTEGETGIIDLNQKDRLTIDQIKYALDKAIANGLKIAIFNSCDGLGLAQQLSALQIPYVVVMREPVPDHIAQQFLRYLLSAFAGGLPFHLAVREARQRLAGLDAEIPCASWLPIVWQNPTAPAILWQDLQAEQAASAFLGARRLKWALSTVVTTGIVLGLRALSLLEPFEMATYDHLMRMRPAEEVDTRIVAVEISQDATTEYGYPLSDEALATLVERLSQAEPMAIGVDIHRPQALTGASDTDAVMSTGYDRFLETVFSNPNLFVVCAYGNSDENYRAPLQLTQTLRTQQVGFSDLPTDGFALVSDSARSDLTAQASTAVAGAKVRRHLLSYDPTITPEPSNCITPYSLSFQLADQYLYELGVEPLTVTDDQHWQFGSVVFESLPRRFGGYQRLEGVSSQILLNYRANQPARKVTLAQVLSEEFDLSLLRDRIVIVGYTAPVSKDYFETPYGPMAGMWIHAHMVSQMISAVLDERPLMRALPQWHSWQWGDMLWVLCWSGAGGVIGWRVRRRSRWALSTVALLLALYGACWVGAILGFWLPLIPSAIASSMSATWLRLGGRRSEQSEQPNKFGLNILKEIERARSEQDSDKVSGGAL